MAKYLIDKRPFAGDVVVMLYAVGGTVRDSTYTVEVHRRGRKVDGETGITGGLEEGVAAYQTYITMAERGDYARR
jgi:hypothetical protein